MKKTFLPGDEGEPHFDLPVENELLMLKLRAEFGAECKTAGEDIPPEVVNEFLKSVYEFELKFRSPRPLITIYEKIGKPFFRRSWELADKQLTRELRKLQVLLKQHSLQLDVLGTYPDRVIYKFITEEFFRHEMEDLDLPGYIHHFCYEEFHPNHELDVRERCVEFMSQWFARKLNEYSWQLADPFIHPDSRNFSREQVLRKIDDLFASYVSFSNCEYRISELTYDWDEKKGRGTAFVSGSVRYDAATENHERVHEQGPFQFYLSNSGSWWSIFYFVFPGFNWNH